MKKRIIITSGPTNEQIDAVMKITNMSTGALGSTIAETFLRERSKNIEEVYYLSPKLALKPRLTSPLLDYITVESTQDLLDELTHLLTTERIDAVVHSAAVGDYKASYTIRAEDLIDEIIRKQAEAGGVLGYDELMEIFDSPEAVQNDSTKISSYEPHLMTMLTLTPKVISSIKKLSPSTTLVGFKLLEGIARDELLNVASRLREKNQADYIIANDLSKIGNGKHWAMVVGASGVETECETKQEIADAILARIF